MLVFNCSQHFYNYFRKNNTFIFGGEVTSPSANTEILSTLDLKLACIKRLFACIIKRPSYGFAQKTWLAFKSLYIYAVLKRLRKNIIQGKNSVTKLEKIASEVRGGVHGTKKFFPVTCPRYKQVRKVAFLSVVFYSLSTFHDIMRIIEQYSSLQMTIVSSERRYP